MKLFGTLRVLALALLMVSTLGGDGSDCPNTDGTDCPQTDCPQTDCPQTDCPNTQGTEGTATHDTQGTEGCVTQDTQGTEGCMTQDTQSCDQSCSYGGPQVNGGFWDGPTGSDSNPCCMEYRVGPFVYVDPIWNPIDFNVGGGGYVAPTPHMPADDRRGSYVPPTASLRGAASSSARPDWQDQEWVCEFISEKGGLPCNFVNSPIYNHDKCGMCDHPRPVAETPSAPPMPSNVDPLTIQSPNVVEGAEKTGMCCVCMDRINDIVLLGAKDAKGQYKCRHQCMCRQCAASMRALPRAADRRCPMCRVPTQFYVVADTVPKGVQMYHD